MAKKNVAKQKGADSLHPARWAIRPLEWKRDFQEWRQRVDAWTPFGSYYVERIREGCEDNTPWEPWYWGYCFDEYYNEGREECDSEAAGRTAAEEHWIAALTPTLIESPNVRDELPHPASKDLNAE